MSREVPKFHAALDARPRPRMTSMTQTTPQMGLCKGCAKIMAIDGKRQY
jgi:hypothetical protein